MIPDDVRADLQQAGKEQSVREALEKAAKHLDVLNYLMQQFDGETWQCEVCGHAEDTATMDSANYLREYLGTLTEPKDKS